MNINIFNTISKDRLIIAFVGLLISLGLILMSNFNRIQGIQEFDIEKARVVSVNFENTWEDMHIPGVQVGSQMVTLLMTSGPFKGEYVDVENMLTRFHSYPLSVNQNVLVSIMHGASDLTSYNITISTPQRSNVLFIGLALLMVLVVLVAKTKGIYALLSLAFTFVIVIYLLVHGIIFGGSPIFLSILSSLLIIIFVSAMMHGLNKQTLASISGAFVGLLAATLASYILSTLGHVSGLQLDSVRQILYNTPSEVVINIPNLFFAVVIIAITGVMIDSSISISSTIFELDAQNQSLSLKALYNSGMQVGRNILGANLITMILAFVGTSLVSVMLIIMFGFSQRQIINMDLFAIEMVQGMAAALGILVGIPATALFSSLICKKEVGV